MDKTEKNLTQLYHELRARDAQRMPAFDSVTSASTVGVQPPRMAFLWVRFAAAAVAASLLLAAIALRTREHSTAVEVRQWEVVSAWQAPTDRLLNVPGVPWGTRVSTATDSWIGSIVISPESIKE